MAVSVSYYLRNGSGITILGSSTPPTAIQASGCQTQLALISFADSDTQALFTHNMGLDASAPSYLEPPVEGYGVYGPAQAAQTYMPAFTFDFSNTNVLKINKLNFLGTGGTYFFRIRRAGVAL
jgi:hypothetical protein